MITRRTRHIDNHRVIKHRTIPFGDRCELPRHLGYLFEMQLLDFHPSLMPSPPVGGFILLQVANRVNRIGKIQFRILHSQRIRTEGYHVCQAGNQRSRRQFKMGFNSPDGARVITIG